MAGLLEHDKTQTPEAPAAAGPVPVAPDAPVVEPAGAPEVPAEPLGRPCTTCSAPLASGQDWCLECGSAQPGRLGGRPGWRAAMTVIGATVLLATGAGAAAYAALESEATREATAPAPPPATPTQPTVPPTTETVPPPTTETTPPTDTVDPPASDPADVPEPSDDTPSSSTPVTPSPSPSPSVTPTPTPTPSPSPTPSPGTGSSGGNGTTGTDTTPAEPEPVEIELKSDFASTYDPYERGGKAVSDPANAVDGKKSTAWEAPVGPEGEVRVGLLISLEKAQKLGNLKLKADTPGFTVETYATKSSQVPPDVLDARWKHLDDARDVGVEETLKLDGTFRHVLLWITAQPADTKVAIPEVTLFEPKD